MSTCFNTWENTLTNLRNYIYQHGSFPLQRASGLGKWTCVQRSAFKMRRMHEDRRPKWEKFIKEMDTYLKNIDSSKDQPSVNEEWENCFRRLQVFVVLNGRLPVLRIGKLVQHAFIGGSTGGGCRESELALWYQEQLERCSVDSEESNKIRLISCYL